VIVGYGIGVGGDNYSIGRKTDVPMKVHVMALRLLQGRLAKREESTKIGILTSASDINCIFCSNEVESISHIFLSCLFS
jgi:hypothetical protein